MWPRRWRLEVRVTSEKKCSFTVADVSWQVWTYLHACVFINSVCVFALFAPHDFTWTEKSSSHVPARVFTCVLWSVSLHLTCEFVSVRVWSRPPAVLADAISSWSNISFSLSLSLLIRYLTQSVCPCQGSNHFISLPFTTTYLGHILCYFLWTLLGVFTLASGIIMLGRT